MAADNAPGVEAETEPDDAFRAALEMHQGGDPQGAIAAYREILAADPDHALAISSLGVALRATGRGDEALDLLREGARRHPEDPDLNYNFGNALRDAGELEAAVETYGRVLERAPAYLGAALNLGVSLEKLGRYADARVHYQDAVRRHPYQAELVHNLGVVLFHEKRLAAAQACYQRAVDLKPDYPEAWFHLGLVLEGLGRHGEAEAAHGRALALRPDDADTLAALGQTLLSLGRIDDAIQRLEAALAIDDQLLDAHLGLARGRLLAGELQAGWEEFAWRRERETWIGPDLAGPVWDGNELGGRTLLLYWEQGMGDIIQFARYASLVARGGGRVLLHCPGPLVRLLETLEGIAGCVADGDPLPEYDVKYALLDLPGLLGTELATIPGDCPYLSPPTRTHPDRSDDQVLRVGLVWAGNSAHQRDRDRSCPLSTFAPLLAQPGAAFYGLQTGPQAEELEACGFDGLIRDLGSELSDFAHTADILAQLDLLVTVDTAAAHLAGALALPVWNLLAHAPDWRWMLGRADTPWYPTMRLYRQSAPGDWESVMERVAQDLRAAAAERRG